MTTTAGLVLGLTTGGVAQQLSAAAGFARVPGRVGADESDHGLGSRLGLYLGARRLVSFGLELGFDRFNTDVRRSGPGLCVLPGGTNGNCFYRRENRDVGISISGLARIEPRTPGVSPYAVVGLGVLSSRTRQRQETTDDAGNHVPNLEFDGTLKDSYLMVHLGAGLAIPLRGSSLAITLEGRVSPVLYNYSGAPGLAIGQSLLAGIRFGR